MSSVVLLTTGGTIASNKDEETGLLKAGILTGVELLSKHNILSDVDVKVEVESIFQIPSNQMTFNHLFILRDKINEICQNKSNIDGIVITHGTDTLEETAYFLDLTISNERPIVITGSQKAPIELGTDAFHNIRQSIMVAIDRNAKGFGAVVLFNERIFSARYVKKVHAYNTNAFNSFGYGYLGVVDKDRVYIYQKPIKKEFYKVINSRPSPIIDIIKFALDSDGKFIYCSIRSGAKGIILEGAGRGHIPPKALEAVNFAISKGVRVILTTSCEEGEVFPVYDFAGGVKDLQERGVIIGKDLDSKKARIKLFVLLSAGITDVESIQKSFLE